MKIWTSTEKGTDRIIALGGDSIFKGNPKTPAMEAAIAALNEGVKQPADLFSIPFGYIKTINFQQSKPYIEILFGADSSEHLNIRNEEAREEVFEYFKQHIPGVACTVEKHSALKAGIKPLIALTILAVIFSWTLYLAIEMSKGFEYDVVGQRYNSIAGIALSLASLGIPRLCLIFAALESIALLSFFRKIKQLPVVHTLSFLA